MISGLRFPPRYVSAPAEVSRRTTSRSLYNGVVDGALRSSSCYAKAVKFIDERLSNQRRPNPLLQLPIHLACERQSKKAYYIVKRILEVYEYQSLERDSDGSLPVHLALKAGNINTAELLLSYHTEQQSCAVDGAGDTLLHLACRSGSMDAVRVAIASGCDDANMQNAVGRTALHEVAYLGDQNLLKVMFKLRANANVLDKVSRRQRRQNIQIIIKH
ncbi:unnamed protein product [Nippostrongylus brasiliensis]|uniref:Putative ankyrin 2,3/unc44 (inferred by orthology to a S. mansoni protein) n=1 Tax=Nippostrongylus brasiliensis TaxID=27835 RepID=A0A0N4XM88_NIPBR|nr:unnamed protein product [Nippostrongylus brasiliensis]